MCVCNDDISRTFFSVAQADKEFPECQDLPAAILDKIKNSVFRRRTFKKVNNANRGQYA